MNFGDTGTTDTFEKLYISYIKEEYILSNKFNYIWQILENKQYTRYDYMDMTQ
jgi:hypothetical protein